MAVALGQWSRHSVQKVLRECRCLSPACPINYSLAACKILLEAAAKPAHTLLSMAAEAEHLVLVMVTAGVIFFLYLSHTRGMAQVGLLIWARPAEVLYDLGGARVQAVEVCPLLPVKADPCVAVDASQPVHQLRTHLLELIFACGKCEVLVVCDHLERTSAPSKGLTCTLDIASNPAQPNGDQAQ